MYVFCVLVMRVVHFIVHVHTPVYMCAHVHYYMYMYIVHVHIPLYWNMFLIFLSNCCQVLIRSNTLLSWFSSHKRNTNETCGKRFEVRNGVHVYIVCVHVHVYVSVCLLVHVMVSYTYMYVVCVCVCLFTC